MKRCLLSVPLLAVVLAACARQTKTEPRDPPQIPSAAVAQTKAESKGVQTLTVLFTSDEHGWMQPHGEKGGAVALLSQWLAQENLCIASATDDCSQSSTIAISGGDNWTGPAISAHYKGIPMAETMKALGYVGSALGNHELDFGQEAVRQNAKIQGYDFLAANLRWDSSSLGLPVKPMLMIHRAGIKIAIVGIATTGTPKHLLPESSKGLIFDDEEQSLARVIPEAWKAGADLVITTSHVCPHDVVRYVNNHPEWHLAFAGAGHCHATVTQMAGPTPVIEPGSELRSYGRIKIVVDLAKAQQQRVVSSTAELVEIAPPAAKTLSAEPRVSEMARQVSAWQGKIDEALGEEIGYTEKGLENESPAMIRWILGAWKEQFKADVAITNRWSMRQALPAGTVKLQHIFDILPFDNRIVRIKLKGSELIESATCCHGAIEGMKQEGDRWILSTGRPVQGDKIYQVVTSDYTYMGGSGFKFRNYDPNGEVLMNFREPVIAWTRAHKSTASKPLELILSR